VPLRAVVNPAVEPGAVPAPSDEAAAFHTGLPGYRPTPVHELSGIAGRLGLQWLGVKDESDRLGLPAFKVLGASWAVERTLREQPAVDTLVAASAGNHGRAVAHVAARRGLACRVYLPARSMEARRRAIVAEGAEVIVVDGSYEDAVAAATAAGSAPRAAEIADVGDSGPAHWVIDGYQTLFAELSAEHAFDLLKVPVGVGSLAAAAARFAAHAGIRVVGVEPDRAACLGASLAAGTPTAVATPGTAMAGLDCAEVSPAAWPSLLRGIHGTVAVSDNEADAAVEELAATGLSIGHSGAATLAGLTALVTDSGCAELRDAVGLGPSTRVLAIATEGRTDLDP
jgi:diaminopropionate ammonia-lyase